MAKAATPKAQGYLPMTQRPACRNCWAHDQDKLACSLGDFDVDWSGWCPQWIPTAAWIDANPTSAQGLGLSRNAIPIKTQVAA
jgi:hypothetical protein